MTFLSPNFRGVLPVLFAVSAGLLAGCGDAEVPKADVEKVAMTQLSASVGKPSPQITCPGNLKAKVGATLVCAMDIDGKIHDVNVNVTSVDGTNAKFDVAVAEKARP